MARSWIAQDQTICQWYHISIVTLNESNLTFEYRWSFINRICRRCSENWDDDDGTRPNCRRFMPVELPNNFVEAFRPSRFLSRCDAVCFKLKTGRSSLGATRGERAKEQLSFTADKLASSIAGPQINSRGTARDGPGHLEWVDTLAGNNWSGRGEKVRKIVPAARSFLLYQ